MADITMCSGQGCPMKEKCYRFMAIPNIYRQSYFVNPPIKSDGTCESFGQDSTKYEIIKFNLPDEFLKKIDSDLIDSQIRLFLNQHHDLINSVESSSASSFQESVSLFSCILESKREHGCQEIEVRVQDFICKSIRNYAKENDIEESLLFDYFVILGESQLASIGL